MNTPLNTQQLAAILAFAALSTLDPLLSTALAQGGLTPPGAPAPTMKTLDQVEPRTPISSLPYSITNSGSYYLTTNLTGIAGQNGITLQASDVTIDLNGFTLAGLTNSVAAFTASGVRSNLTVRNGNIRDWPGGGMGLSAVFHCRLDHLNVVNCNSGILVGENSVVTHCISVGNGLVGISAGPNATVADCTTRTNLGNGIAVGHGSTITACASTMNTNAGFHLSSGSTAGQCAARGNGGSGFFALEDVSIQSCIASFNEAHGIVASSGATIVECTARANTGDGIHAGQGSFVQRCMATLNRNDGIEVSFGSFVLANNCRDNGVGANDGAGIHVTNIDNRIEDNTVTLNDRGIDVDSGFNLIIRNSARNNTTNYDIAENNKVGVIVFAPNSAAILGITGGAGVGTTDPWANISF